MVFMTATVPWKDRRWKPLASTVSSLRAGHELPIASISSYLKASCFLHWDLQLSQDVKLISTVSTQNQKVCLAGGCLSPRRYQVLPQVIMLRFLRAPARNHQRIGCVSLCKTTTHRGVILSHASPGTHPTGIGFLHALELRRKEPV